MSVGLAALLISAVTVNKWRKSKGIKTQMEGNTEFYSVITSQSKQQVYNDEDEGTVDYENTGDSPASVRLH